ncbi:MAG TPA: pyridoxine 5'-phosphate synthase [Candidatus Omnitrophota bacterium]|nr:pyridoxine 5'-phosphate synthase [Candidatus Omnitrophota bacterium]HPD85258.1 pyridoxine 5'-phosphate synthase [Candidatus Omnitrophota bacterium]HRZ04241.1 pyridoxine 5'-phosphate synthase [Candidatus Omnitrophota bacterium]
MAKLGVNIDHVATLRQARREFEPDPIHAARICEKAGAHSIVAHLREDRRHINDADVKRLRKIVSGKFNLEMSIHPEIVAIALRLKPDQATLVPERRKELTTEGGLDVVSQFSRIKKVVAALRKKGITVSLFIDPVKIQIKKSYQASASAIEIHTGRYARAKSKAAVKRELNTLRECVRYAKSLGLTVHAGHGLNYKNAKAVAEIAGIEELNIGHSIISRAVFTGLERAVREMIAIIK